MSQMHKLLYFFSLLILLTGCGEPKEFDPINIELTGSMKASVNGAEWNSKLNCTFIFDKTSSQMIISGFEITPQNTRRTITLTINALEESTYVQPIATAAFTDGTAEDTWMSTECNVLVSSVDLKQKLASGTFTFTATSARDNSTRTITQGEFKNIPLLEQ